MKTGETGRSRSLSLISTPMARRGTASRRKDTTNRPPPRSAAAAPGGPGAGSRTAVGIGRRRRILVQRIVRVVEVEPDRRLADPGEAPPALLEGRVVDTDRALVDLEVEARLRVEPEIR